MKILVGLGNPGEKYTRNRHNAGYVFADYFVKKFTEDNNIPPFEWKHDKYSNSQIITISDNQPSAISHKLLAIKPQTFMNRSGETVRKLAINYRLPSNDLYVAHDDLDIALGKFKIQKSTGPKLHNGLESIEQAIGTKDFWRIRIGVENRPSENRMPGEAFVLQNFTEDEKHNLNTVFHEIYDRILETIQQTLL